LLITQLTVARDNRLERVALQNITPNKVKWFSLLFLEFAALLGIASVHVVNGRALLVACFIFLGGTNPFSPLFTAAGRPSLASILCTIRLLRRLSTGSRAWRRFTRKDDLGLSATANPGCPCDVAIIRV